MNIFSIFYVKLYTTLMIPGLQTINQYKVNEASNQIVRN